MKRLSLLLAASVAACAGNPKVAAPPIAAPTPQATAPAAALAPARVTTKRDDIVDTVHGTPVPDPYRWLEQVDSPETQAWMTAEDKRAREAIAQLPGREALAKRLTELTYLDTMGIPQHEGKRFFYSKQFADKEKSIYFVRNGSAETALLDGNTMSPDGSVSFKEMSPSPDGKLVAWRRHENNADDATLFIRDVATGKDLADRIPGARYASAQWTPDSKGFYYVVLPIDPSIAPTDLPGKAVVKYHRVGDDPSKDVVILPARGTSSQFLSATPSHDGKWLVATIAYGRRSNDLYFRPLGKKPQAAKGDDRDPEAHGFTKLVAGVDANFDLTPFRGKFYVTSDEGAPRGRVFAVDPARPARDQWQEIVPEPSDPTTTIRSVSVIGGKLVLHLFSNVMSVIEVRGLDGKLVRRVDLPGLGTTSYPSGRPDEDAIYYQFSSPTHFPQIWETSVATGKSKLWQETKPPVDLSPYTTTQVWVESKDRTKIPMFLVHRKDLVKNGQNPVYLYGYGGFNVSYGLPTYTSTAVVWLEKGGVVALPSLRGGGELGEAWHRAGMLDKKQNVFDDFAAAAEYLVREKISSPKKIAISGGSNGGLLVGALMVQRPELFGAVVCSVPLLDMVRYHLHGAGKTWTEEYGSAEDPAQLKTLLAYSPYHHVEQRVAYPPLLMLSADSDDRVDPLHARKFVAMVQWATDRPDSALLRIEGKSGHQGADVRNKTVAKNADTFAWLFATLGMN
jgi:prolyl oligopeptidase